MQTFEAKTLELALASASENLGIQIDDLMYEILEEKKGLLKKYVKISVYETTDIIDHATEYLKTVITAIGLVPEFKTELDGEIIKIEMNTNHNSILIGKNGKTLLALNEITTLAVSTKFKKRIRVLVDINDYKNERYRKVISIAKRVAGEVARSKQDVTLDFMPADERRAIHNALSEYRNVTTESVGSGRERKIVIKYRRPSRNQEKGENK